MSDDKPEIEGEFYELPGGKASPGTEAANQDVVQLKWFRGGAPEKFDDKAKQRFLKVFGSSHNKSAGARAAGVCVQTVNNHIKQDKEFAAACEEARLRWCDRVMQTANYVAIEGTLEPVFSKDGVQIGWRRVHATNILAMMMKVADSAYKDKQEIDLQGKAGGVLLIPVGSQTPEDNQRNGELLALSHSKEPGT